MKLYPNLKNLINYTPKERGFTSNEEINLICNTLQLDEASYDDLYNYRTLVVVLWGNMERSEDDMKKSMQITEAMQSITAVLDMKMVSYGMEV